jgi:glycosyltransferase involved in cell wall biosynthesis
LPGADPYIVNAAIRLLMRRHLRDADIIVAHYALSAWAAEDYASKTLIVSHGVEWHTENQDWNDRAREAIARRWFDRCTHVVNDTHYLRNFGLAIAPATGYFTEIAPGKWFIPNCVDAARFSRTQGIEELRQRNIVLVPRQITRDRGIDLAIRAFRLFLDEHPGHTLFLLGPVREPEYLKQCLDLAQELGVRDSVLLQSHVQNQAMPDYYSSAVMTLIPTLRREGTSLSALESMCCGTATVSTNVAGLRDLPTVQSDPEPVALARALSATLVRRSKIAAEQSQAVRATFSFRNWSEAWLKVVNSVRQSKR